MLRANAQLTGFILVGSSKALTYTNEHIYVYKITYFILSST